MQLQEMLDQIENFDKRLLKRQKLNLRTESFIGLLGKLIESEKQAVLNPETYPLVLKTYSAFMHYTQENHMDRKAKNSYFTLFSQLIKHVGKAYGLVPRGTYTSMYIGVGIAIGAALGIVLKTHNDMYYTLGISLGLLIGVSLGTAQENKLKKEGKIF